MCCAERHFLKIFFRVRFREACAAAKNKTGLTFFAALDTINGVSKNKCDDGNQPYGRRLQRAGGAASRRVSVRISPPGALRVNAF